MTLGKAQRSLLRLNVHVFFNVHVDVHVHVYTVYAHVHLYSKIQGVHNI